MFKIIGKGAALLMLLGAMVGSMAVTNASAKSKVNKEVAKINISNIFNANTTFTTGIGVTEKNETISPYNRFQTYKLNKSLKLTNEFKHKTATLPKGSVITGYADDQGNIINVDNTTLSIKNQKRVKKLGNWHYSYPMNKVNNGAVKKYVRNTAFSYNSLASVPKLSVKTSQAQYDGAATKLPFISVTADSQLVYHKSGQSFGATYYAKIKKFKRTHSTITYYLNKRVNGVTTKRTKIGKHYRYKLSLKLGNVFQSRDSYNGDAGAYNLTVKNGKQSFFLLVEEHTVLQAYLNTLTGNESISTNDKDLSLAYINSLH